MAVRRITIEVEMTDEEIGWIIPSGNVFVVIHAKLGRPPFEGEGEIVRLIDKPQIGV